MKFNLYSLYISTLFFSFIAQGQLLESIGLTELPSDQDPIIFGQDNGSGGSTVGNPVADFKLYNLDGDSIVLSEVLSTGKHVLMVSGSYTCPIFRNHMTELNSINSIYGDQIECFVVYIKEAHPIGSSQPTNPLYNEPQTYGERKAIIVDMINGVGEGPYVPTTISTPIYIDGCNNEWRNHYGGPNRAYLINNEGELVAYHQWFNNSNPPNGTATNIWCDIDALLDIETGGCNEITSLEGAFEFNILSNSSPSVIGNPGDNLDSFGELINISDQGVLINIERVMNNMPSATWSSSMCASVCYPPTQDTLSVTIAAGDTLDFAMHFYTDALMSGPDTGKVRIKFSNASGTQDPIYRMYKGITVNNLSVDQLESFVNKDPIKIIDILGREVQPIPNQVLFYIYDDGTVLKKVLSSNYY